MTDTYYLRATSRAELVAIGVDLGLLVDDAEGTRPADLRVSWTEIGALYDGEQIIADEHGTPYWHANLMIDDDITLIEWAQAAYAAADGELQERIGQHLANSAAYFPLDEQGAPRKPNSPAVVYWR